jgi:hypothetical protein
MLDDMKQNGDGRKLKSYSKQSVELVHEACRMMFAKAISIEMIKFSPIIDAEIPAYQQTVDQLEAETELPEYLEKEELAKLLRTASQSDDQQVKCGI